MSGAAFRALGGGRFEVVGALGFETAADVWEQSRTALAAGDDLAIDLGGVTEVDSAGLALLIEWLRTARAGGRRLRFNRIPENLRALARISEVEGFLQADDRAG